MIEEARGNDRTDDCCVSLDAAKDNSAPHKKVLRSLKALKVAGYEMLVEETGSQLALPNEFFGGNGKGEAQRKRNLLYVDSILHQRRAPRVLLEMVDGNPTSPNGITGLAINADRIAEIHPNIDLIFVVLCELKDYFCGYCGHGHRLSNQRRLSCWKTSLGPNPGDDVVRGLIHEGKAAAFKKALIDYPICDYLHRISPPSVVFLNATKVATAWGTYERAMPD